jgi:hypothetical protein
MPDCPYCGAHFRFTRRFGEYFGRHISKCTAEFETKKAIYFSKLDEYNSKPWWRRWFIKFTIQEPKMFHPDGDPFIKFVNKVIDEKNQP